MYLRNLDNVPFWPTLEWGYRAGSPHPAESGATAACFIRYLFAFV
jgi:hypothetical protein